MEEVVLHDVLSGLVWMWFFVVMFGYRDEAVTACWGPWRTVMLCAFAALLTRAGLPGLLMLCIFLLINTATLQEGISRNAELFVSLSRMLKKKYGIVLKIKGRGY